MESLRSKIETTIDDLKKMLADLDDIRSEKCLIKAETSEQGMSFWM